MYKSFASLVKLILKYFILFNAEPSLSLFADDIILYVENTKDSTHLKLINVRTNK